MPATKKKAQLDPLERRSVALLWAYNGSDLVLLTFLLDERRFDEYCQTNRKNFRVLSLGTWFSIKYQRYVKCETRINVLDVSVLEGKPPLDTRVLNAVVQLCVPFVCSKANSYTDQFIYKSSIGNIVLRKSQGGGPKHLLIWCSLQTVAWWMDPMLEEIVTSHTENDKVPTKMDRFVEGNGRTKEKETSANDKWTSLAHDPKGVQSVDDCEINNNDIKLFGIERRSDDRSERWNCQKNTTKRDAREMVSPLDTSSLCDSWDECLHDEIDVDPDFGAANEFENGQFVAEKEETEDQINRKLEEEFEWSRYDTVRSFDWATSNVGIVVERVEMTPRNQMDTNLFSVFPLCTGERYPGILRLWTRQSLQTGHWIGFRKSWSPFGSLKDGEYCPHPPMFRTLSFLGRVVIECEVIFPYKKGDEIRTSWECPQNQLSSRSSSPTPFIRYIEDERCLFGQRFLGTRRWAVLEHVPMEWSPTKSWWKIVHVRPVEFDKLFY